MVNINANHVNVDGVPLTRSTISRRSKLLSGFEPSSALGLFGFFRARNFLLLSTLAKDTKGLAVMDTELWWYDIREPTRIKGLVLSISVEPFQGSAWSKEFLYCLKFVKNVRRVGSIYRLITPATAEKGGVKLEGWSSGRGGGVQGEGVEFRERGWSSGRGGGVQGEGMEFRQREWSSGRGGGVQGEGVEFRERGLSSGRGGGVQAEGVMSRKRGWSSGKGGGVQGEGVEFRQRGWSSGRGSGVQAEGVMSRKRG